MIEPTTDKQWAAYLTETLRRLEKLAETRSTDPWLQARIKETRELLAILIGYLIG
jgi:hypothetical protein